MSTAAETTIVEVVNLTLNGREVQARPGQTILEVARENGVDIPTLCHDPRLEPYGACRLCLVEVEGARGPMASCGAKVTEGMKVETHTEKIVKLRKFLLELLLTNHPLDCPVCEAAGDCRLQDYAYEYLVDMVPWGWRPPAVGEPGDHPNVAHFGARCILCGRCVRICREVMSIGCWGYLNRGYDSEVDTPYRLPLREVGCISCGQCVSTCPVGAITTQRTEYGARAWQTDKVRTVCSYCSNGCELIAHSYEGHLVKIQSEPGKGINQGSLCVRGRFGQGYVNAPDRLTQPMVRDDSGQLQPASWTEALSRVSDAAAAARAKGGAAFAAVCGSHVTSEAAYLLQKLARTVMGSESVDSLDLYRRREADTALERTLGSSCAGVTRDDVASADALLVIGANVTESNPVLSLWAIKALREGKPVVVVDPCATGLARRTRFHLAVRPGADLPLLRGLLASIVEAADESQLGRVSLLPGFAELKASLAGVDVNAEAQAAGVDAGLLREAAGAFAAAKKTVVLAGAGILEGTASAQLAGAIADFVLLAGAGEGAEAGIMPLQYSANAQGLKDMGIVPGQGGKSVAEAIDALEDGTVSFMYVVGEDPALGLADEVRTRSALEAAPFLVVQDSYLTDTAAYAHVVLPAAVPTEVEGTYTNGEGYVQRVRRVVRPLEGSRPDWEIIRDVAVGLGADWTFDSPEDVMTEISAVVNGYRAVSYGALEERALPVHGAEEKIEEDTVPATGGTKAFAPLPGGSMPAVSGAERPFMLITGSVREHHGTGVRSRRSDGLTKLVAEARVRINPGDAGRLEIADGDAVTVSAADDKAITLPAEVTTRVPEGVVFVPGFSAEAPVTRLLPRAPAGPIWVSVDRSA